MSSPDADDPVLVGADGSQPSLAAVRWAADEARRLGSPLRIVHTWMWPLYRVQLGAPPGAPEGSGLRAQAERVLTEAVDVARTVSPETPIETDLITGPAAPELVSAAGGARLLVVGNRGLGGFAGLLLGSVGVTASAHAPCPVVVVRGTPSPDGPVVVGVDGSTDSAAAVSTAFAEASLRGAELLAVHAWALPLRQAETREGTDGYQALAASGELAGKEVVEQALEGGRRKFPEVAISVRLGAGSAASELVAASEGAQLAVVGSRGLGGLRGLLLGSTAQALLQHSHCPVLVHRG